MNTPDKAAIRRAFERAAPGYAAAAGLQKEVARRLDEHLEGIRIGPGRILDAGCGTGIGWPLLKARFPEAALVGLDLAYAMVCEARRQNPAPGLPQRLVGLFKLGRDADAWVCGDIERLPLARDSVDMVWSSLALQWVGDPEGAFREFQRVLRPEGLLMFSTFGPDTLQELRAAFAEVDGYGHVNRFIDMHDIGDALLHAGFASPVVEMERLTLTYADLKGVLRDLKEIGAHTVLEGGRRGLMGRQGWQRLEVAYERFRRGDRLPATYEVIYGHAWAGRKDRLADGRQVIEFKIREKRGGLS